MTQTPGINKMSETTQFIQFDKGGKIECISRRQINSETGKPTEVTVTKCKSASGGASPAAIVWWCLLGVVVVSAIVCVVVHSCRQSRKKHPPSAQIVIGAAAAPESSSNVKEIQNYGELLQLQHSHVPLVVMVGAPWCPHCQTTKPEFEQASKLAKEGVRFVYVDGSVIQEIHDKVDIPGYPFFFTIGADGKIDTTQPSQRTPEAISALSRH